MSKQVKSNASLVHDGEDHGELDRLRSEISDLQRQLAQQQHLASTDTLTPLYNRRYFMETLQRWSWRAQRGGGDCAILLLDVDNLKAVNDKYGHLAGDKMLCVIADILISKCRKTDIAARIGGDEFAILLDGADSAAVEQKAIDLQRAVAAQSLTFGREPVSLSIAVGWSSIKAGEDAELPLARADRQMYREKRNRKCRSI